MDPPPPPTTTDTPKRGGSTRSSKGSKRGSGKRGSQKSMTRSSQRGSRRAMPQRLQKSYRSKALAWLEPRLLIITTGVTLLGVFLQIIAISTDSWIIITASEGAYKNVTGKFILEAYTGLWRFCKVELLRSFSTEGKLQSEKISSCERHNLFPDDDETSENKGYEQQQLDYEVKDMLQTDYTRTAIAFTIIAILIMTIGHAFAFYALRRPRYILKRLAALLHFMAAACLLVLNEVFSKTVEHEKDQQYSGLAAEAETNFGYSFILSWLVFVLFVLGGLVFLFTSQKKKAEYAGSREALDDEPMEIFRR